MRIVGGMELTSPDEVATAPLTALGLAGGFVLARESGIRSLGGVLLATAGVLAGRSWWARGGLVPTAALSALYVGGFIGSHPLAKRIGAWPSVALVTGANMAAAHLISDSRAD